jgi:glycosyltransferase involved in cell wall biosynthesis
MSWSALEGVVVSPRSMSKPAPRALFASYSPLLGGAERLLLDYSTGMESAVVACPEGPLARAARGAGLSVVALSAQPLEFRRSLRDRIAAPARIAMQARELRRAIRRLRPEVVFGWSMRGLLVSAVALRSLRARPALIFQHNDFLPPGSAAARAVRAAARRSSRVVCLSRAIAEDLDPQGRLGDRMGVVHPGVDLSRFSPAPSPASSEALFLGAIVGWKRPDLALEVASLVARSLPEFGLRVVGGPLGRPGELLFEQLRRRGQRRDLHSRVRFDGPLPDPTAALRGAGCLLHCAEREPFGLALIEALACGVPVIAPAAGGPCEIVDAGCGVLYPPGDAAAAAAALQDVLSTPDRRARLAAGARARAERLFDRERARADYRRLVSELGG